MNRDKSDPRRPGWHLIARAGFTTVYDDYKNEIFHYRREPGDMITYINYSDDGNTKVALWTGYNFVTLLVRMSRTFNVEEFLSQLEKELAPYHHRKALENGSY